MWKFSLNLVPLSSHCRHNWEGVVMLGEAAKPNKRRLNVSLIWRNLKGSQQSDAIIGGYKGFFQHQVQDSTWNQSVFFEYTDSMTRLLHFSPHFHQYGRSSFFASPSLDYNQANVRFMSWHGKYLFWGLPWRKICFPSTERKVTAYLSRRA